MNEPLIDRRPWRVGNHWGVTVIAEGHSASDEIGRRLGDELVATAQTKEWAQRICDDHNAILDQERSTDLAGLDETRRRHGSSHRGRSDEND